MPGPNGVEMFCVALDVNFGPVGSFANVFFISGLKAASNSFGIFRVVSDESGVNVDFFFNFTAGRCLASNKSFSCTYTHHAEPPISSVKASVGLDMFFGVHSSSSSGPKML